jgi:hypothetical protein
VSSELHDGEVGDQPEVPHVDGQHGVANLQCRCPDQQIAEGDGYASALLLAIDLLPASSAVSFVYG